jgi:Na+/H+ antiporter NhaC
LLAFITREVVTSIFLGTLLGAVYICDNSPLQAFFKVTGEYIKNSAADPDHAAILIFSAALGGLVGIMSRSGGTIGIVNLLVKYAKGRRSAQLITWCMGLVIFFDDYANTLLVGNTMRPVTDKLKVSREKLSYIVDSTAAPVACLAVISTWVGYEISLIKDASAVNNLLNMDAYIIFIKSIPYRFYNIYTLVMVFFIAWLGRDFGPMLKAEQRVCRTGQVNAPDASPLCTSEGENFDLPDDMPKRAVNALIPVVFIIIATLFGLYYTGKTALMTEYRKEAQKQLAISKIAVNTDPKQAREPTADQTKAGQTQSNEIKSNEHQSAQIEAIAEKEFEKAPMRDIISNSDSFSVLLWASVSGSILAGILCLVQNLLTLEQTIQAWTQGVKSMVPAFIILVLAWSIGNVCTDLKTGEFIAEAIQKTSISASYLPALIFILAALTAFSTGTSWGTMAILIPIVIKVLDTLYFGGKISNSLLVPIYLSSVSSVLAGATFGDHCSPISDTTIMSSMASGADHLDHVKTQMPYAVLTAGAALILGSLPVGFGVSPWIVMPFGLGFILIFIKIFGRKPEQEV